MTAVVRRTAFAVGIREDSDVGNARIRTQRLALEEGFTAPAAAALATAVSELARNVIVHACGGEAVLTVIEENGRSGISAVVRDDGPGITDTARAMEDGYSTGGGLGLGLPSAKRLVDELDVVSIAGAGTTVTLKKWRP